MSRRRPTYNKELAKMAKLSDDLARFDQFQTEILPALQDDLLKYGLDEQALLAKYKSVAAARLITLLTSSGKDASLALAAARDILDRTMGKATERKEVTHRLGNMKDQELDALLLTELDEHVEPDDGAAD